MTQVPWTDIFRDAVNDFNNNRNQTTRQFFWNEACDMTIENPTAEKLMQKLQDVAENGGEIIKCPEAEIDEQSLVVYNSKNQRWFAGFKVDATPKWTKEIFKAQSFPYPNEWNTELKMNLRLLVNNGVDIANLHNFVFEHAVTPIAIDIGSIGNNLNKKTDLDNI